MITVKLPAASWLEIDLYLETLEAQGYLVKALRGEIDAQVAEQEG